MPRQYTVATPSIAPRSAQSGLFNQSLSVRVNLRVSGGICKASWRLAVQPCLPNGVAYSRQRATRCFAHSLGPWHHGSGRRVAPNNSFKPNLLRYGKSVAEKACHAFASTTQVGLTQALGGAGARMDNWTSFVAIALLLGASGGVSATVLAIRLRRDFPDLHRAIDAPTGQERTPFWVFHFLSPAKWRLLPQPWKPWMLLSIVAMSTGVALFLFFLFKFAIGELV